MLNTNHLARYTGRYKPLQGRYKQVGRLKQMNDEREGDLCDMKSENQQSR
jgi:hypothetical protein